MTAFDHRGRALHAGKPTRDMMRASSMTAGGHTIMSPTAAIDRLRAHASGIDMGDYFEPGVGMAGGQGDEFDIEGVSVPHGFSVEHIPGEEVRGLDSAMSPRPVKSYIADDNNWGEGGTYHA
jgi:hypothetical protein